MIRGKQFFNQIILKTFSSVFKHTVCKAPPSFPQTIHPIVALALTCISVNCLLLFTFKCIMKT